MAHMNYGGLLQAAELLDADLTKQVTRGITDVKMIIESIQANWDKLPDGVHQLSTPVKDKANCRVVVMKLGNAGCIAQDRTKMWDGYQIATPIEHVEVIDPDHTEWSEAGERIKRKNDNFGTVYSLAGGKV